MDYKDQPDTTDGGGIEKEGGNLLRKAGVHSDMITNNNITCRNGMEEIKGTKRR